MKLLPLIAALCLLCLAACRTTPDMVLPEEEMAALIADLELADAHCVDQSLGVFYNDSMRRAMRSSVLAKHGINEAVLDSSFRWYGAHLPQYLKVIERADSILADSLRALDAEVRLAATLAAGDSANLWTLPPSAVFARNRPSDFVVFDIPADSSWKRGDLFTLELALDNARSPLNATLAVDYANRARTTDAITGSVYPGGQRRLTLRLQLDSNISAKRLYGYITLSPAPGERAFADSIRLMRTRLVGSEYNQWRRFSRRITRHDL